MALVYKLGMLACMFLLGDMSVLLLTASVDTLRAGNLRGLGEVVLGLVFGYGCWYCFKLFRSIHI